MTKTPTILYEDKDVVVIDKPAGLMVHPDGKSKESTLIDWIEQKYPEMIGVGEPLVVGEETIERPGVVHRLDRDTSGVLILARNHAAHEHLKEQFMGRDAHKVYRAFVYANIAEDRGTIDRPIGKSRTDFRQWSAARNPRGVLRDARTDFRVIVRSSEATYLEVFPHTGRTHQIRVHMKAIQHPVLCDPLYANGRPSLLGFTRLALHALSLRLTLPSGEEKTFEAPLPPEFIEGERLLRESATQLQG
jgi:23S rRNA pseudouridine1911/1915/1917 synthase